MFLTLILSPLKWEIFVATPVLYSQHGFLLWIKSTWREGVAQIQKETHASNEGGKGRGAKRLEGKVLKRQFKNFMSSWLTLFQHVSCMFPWPSQRSPESFWWACWCRCWWCPPRPFLRHYPRRCNRHCKCVSCTESYPNKWMRLISMYCCCWRSRIMIFPKIFANF